MSNKESSKFTFAAIDFVWTLIAYIYFISKPYVVIAGIFYMVPVIIKSFKHWVQQDQKYMFYIYSIIFTVVNTCVLILEISVQFGILTDFSWLKYLLITNTIYAFLGVTECYEPYKNVSKGGTN
jgi:hypothetical protein